MFLWLFPQHAFVFCFILSSHNPFHLPSSLIPFHSIHSSDGVMSDEWVSEYVSLMVCLYSHVSHAFVPFIQGAVRHPHVLYHFVTLLVSIICPCPFYVVCLCLALPSSVSARPLCLYLYVLPCTFLSFHAIIHPSENSSTTFLVVMHVCRACFHILGTYNLNSWSWTVAFFHFRFAGAFSAWTGDILSTNL